MWPRCMPSNVPHVSTVPFCPRGSARLPSRTRRSGIAHHDLGPPALAVANGDGQQFFPVTQRSDIAAGEGAHGLSMRHALGIEIVERLLRQLGYRGSRRQQMEVAAIHRVEVGGINHVESPDAQAPEAGQMRGTPRDVAEVPRERAYVCAATTVNLDVEVVARAPEDPPLMYRNPDRLER